MLKTILNRLDNGLGLDKIKIQHIEYFCYFCGPTKKEVKLRKFNGGNFLFSEVCCSECFMHRFYC